MGDEIHTINEVHFSHSMDKIETRRHRILYHLPTNDYSIIVEGLVAPFVFPPNKTSRESIRTEIRPSFVSGRRNINMLHKYVAFPCKERRGGGAIPRRL